jgi:sigma-B regulation protein RsbU (phosphoserine phosphatase)
MQPPLEAEILFELRLPARPERLTLVRAVVQRTAESTGCGAELCQKLVIAVNEACMNVIQHAYKGDGAGQFTLEAWKNKQQLVFRLTDQAAPADLDKIRPRQLDDIRPGGLGVHFIREIMDDYRMGHLPGGRGNYLEMIKNIE